MNDEKENIVNGQPGHSAELEDYHYQFIVHICKQNQARAASLTNIEFGEPVWDFLLDLMVSEHLDRASSNLDISERLGISESLCKRCADYLLDRAAIFENQNQYTAAAFPWLVSEETKAKIKEWLSGCISEAPVS
ncbi:MAG: hypothetical protein ABJN65_10870 [Parasphingorhabdus sp.]